MLELSVCAEDAKKMAVKEEKYDPGYEAAYGGAYCDRALYDTDQCSLSSNGTGKVLGAFSLSHCWGTKSLWCQLPLKIV